MPRLVLAHLSTLGVAKIDDERGVVRCADRQLAGVGALGKVSTSG